MVKFSLPQMDECVIDIHNGDTYIGTLDAVDIVSLASEASELAEKQSRDTWEVFQDLLSQKHNIEVKNKATCVALYDKANSMLVEIKKKYYQLPKQ